MIDESQVMIIATIIRDADLCGYTVEDKVVFCFDDRLDKDIKCAKRTCTCLRAAVNVAEYLNGLEENPVTERTVITEGSIELIEPLIVKTLEVRCESCPDQTHSQRFGLVGKAGDMFMFLPDNYGENYVVCINAESEEKAWEELAPAFYLIRQLQRKRDARKKH